MQQNEGAIQIINSTTRSAAQMVSAVTEYGNGHMGAGLMRLADWGRQLGRKQGIQQGRVEGVLITGLFSTVLIATAGFFLTRQFRKEEQRNQDEMFDLLDDMNALQREQKHSAIPLCVSCRYNSSGVDLAGHRWQYYVDHLGQQYVRLHHAKKQITSHAGPTQGVILDVHASLAETLDAIIAHFFGSDAVKGDVTNKVDFCEGKGLISANFAQRLRSVHMLCSGVDMPGTSTPDILTQEHSLYTISEARKLVKLAESYLIPADELRDEN